ncbi:MAG: hypothetical protein AAB477_00245 [Patescibacteria group bacterium]
MDQTQLQQQIALYYSKLSPDLQAVFSSMKWMDSLRIINTKYTLNEAQIQTLGTETTLLLIGIINLEEFAETLYNELGIESDVVERIITEVNDSILEPILPSLDQAYQNHVGSLVAEKYEGLEKLDERFLKLPKEVQKAISESHYQQTLYTIASKQKLSMEQMGSLEEATNKVLLGIIHPDKYETELKEKLGLPADKTTELVNDVNEGVLKNIREILKSHWNDGKIGEVKPEDEVPIPPYAQVKTPEAPRVEISVPSINIAEVPIELPKGESDIYQNAGIEMVSEEKSDKEDLAKSIIGSKLSHSVVSKPILSDHSLPKVNSAQPAQQPPAPAPAPSSPAPVAPPAPKHDPYHEAI